MPIHQAIEDAAPNNGEGWVGCAFFYRYSAPNGAMFFLCLWLPLPYINCLLPTAAKNFFPLPRPLPVSNCLLPFGLPTAAIHFSFAYFFTLTPNLRPDIFRICTLITPTLRIAGGLNLNGWSLYCAMVFDMH
jgi:hypothetical protein